MRQCDRRHGNPAPLPLPTRLSQLTSATTITFSAAATVSTTATLNVTTTAHQSSTVTDLKTVTATVTTTETDSVTVTATVASTEIVLGTTTATVLSTETVDETATATVLSTLAISTTASVTVSSTATAQSTAVAMVTSSLTLSSTRTATTLLTVTRTTTALQTVTDLAPAPQFYLQRRDTGAFFYVAEQDGGQACTPGLKLWISATQKTIFSLDSAGGLVLPNYTGPNGSPVVCNSIAGYDTAAVIAACATGYTQWWNLPPCAARSMPEPVSSRAILDPKFSSLSRLQAIHPICW